MTKTVQQLITPTTENEALELLLQDLGSIGFAASSWQEGSVRRTLVQLFARAYAKVTTAVKTVAESSFLSTATSDWLDLLAASHYGLTRLPAVATEGKIQLVSASGSPTYSWSADGLVVSDGGSNLYRVTTAGTIAANETKTFTVRAAATGTAANVANGAITTLVTPLPGVTVSNPADALTQTWITVEGTDLESDARLARRCSLRWSSLTYSSPYLAYELWALEAHASVAKVVVNPPGGNGTVTVVVGTATGAVSSSVLTTIKNYMEDGRRPINDSLSVVSANPVTVTVTATPTVTRGAYANAAVAADTIKKAIDAYLATLPIGGPIVPPLAVGAVVRDQLIETIMAITGVQRASLTTPAADITLGSSDIAVGGAHSITVTEAA